jgi:hypothetical protein
MYAAKSNFRPLLDGGDDDQVAIACSGGRRDPRCWSARFMWRRDGKGELYTYLPPYTTSQFAVNKKVCTVQPQSDCNPTYGASIGRGAFHFEIGQWNHISERIKLNDPGKANGELEVFYNGKSVINVNGLIIRDSDKGRIRGIQMVTFFGGTYCCRRIFCPAVSYDMFFRSRQQLCQSCGH